MLHKSKKRKVLLLSRQLKQAQVHSALCRFMKPHALISINNVSKYYQLYSMFLQELRMVLQEHEWNVEDALHVLQMFSDPGVNSYILKLTMYMCVSRLFC